MADTDDALRREIAQDIYGRVTCEFNHPDDDAGCLRASKAAADVLLAGPIAKHTAALQAERDEARLVNRNNVDLRDATIRANMARIAALTARVEALDAALAPFAKLNAMDPPESVPLNEWLPLVTGARAALAAARQEGGER